MKKVENDIIAASHIIENKQLEIENSDYGKIYHTQTENSRKLFPKLSSKWENSLWIGGSGDQFINGILYGSRNITVIEKNPLAIYYILLKIEAFQVLSKKEFFTSFLLNSMQSESFLYLCDKTDSWINIDNSQLEEDTKYFWRNIIQNYSEQDIRRNLFYEQSLERETESILNRNPYLEKYFYNYLKRTLQRTKFLFYCQDIQEINQIVNIPAFDKIYLSNVFLEMNLSLEEYQSFLEEKIFPLLLEKGEALVGYLNISHFRGANFSNLGTTDEVIDFFKKSNYDLESIFEEGNQISSVFIYRKKR